VCVNSAFRHEKLLKKSFVNKVDMSDGVAHARAFEGQHVQVGGQCDGKSEGQTQQDENILMTDAKGLPFESAQALATSLFEEALKLGGETESHIVGAYAVFLAVVVRTEAALARAQVRKAPPPRLNSNSKVSLHSFSLPILYSFSVLQVKNKVQASLPVKVSL
jgi:hypothetical protein